MIFNVPPGWPPPPSPAWTPPPDWAPDPSWPAAPIDWQWWVPAQATAHGAPATPEQTVRRLADYEKFSGWFWIVLGIVQVVLVVTIIAGVWNIVAGTSRLRAAKLVRARDARVPQVFQGVLGLVVVGVVNVLLGGLVGVIGVAADFFIRDSVLKNAHLFTEPAQAIDQGAGWHTSASFDDPWTDR